MRLKTINESINENYPPGAEHDPSAPYNQSSPDYETVEIEAMVWDEGGENELPVKIGYRYYEDDESDRKHITEYWHEFVNPDDEVKASSGLDDDVKHAIGEDAGKHDFV